MTRLLIFATSLFLLVHAAQAQNLYKWVDEDGNVTYQDSPPPGDKAAKPFAEDPEVAAEAEADARPSVPVTLYSVQVCDACDLVRNLLEKYAVPYEEKDASSNVAVQDEVKKLAGQLSVPVLAIGDSVISGYTSSGITAELTRAGFSSGGDGEAASEEPEAEQETGLTAEEVAQQAADAAAELTADLEELPSDTEFPEDVVEEIPEEEQIKVQVGQ